MPTVSKFDKNAADVKKTLSKWEGKYKRGAAEGEGLLSSERIKENILTDMKGYVKQLDAFRKGGKDRLAVDMTIEKYLKNKLGFGSLNSFYAAVGIDPNVHTMESLATMPDFEEGYRWLIPEVIMAAIRLGLRRQPYYPKVIAAENTVSQKKVTMPHINMSDATPEYVNEAETIPVGAVSFGERDVEIRKLGTGLHVSYEVQKYVALNVLSLYMQDAGVKLGLGLDTLMVDALVNGDDPNGTYSAPVIGVADVAAGITYRDLLRAWIRMGRIGRQPSCILTNEDAGVDLLMMDEFRKWSANTNTAHQNVNLNLISPIPNAQDLMIHGACPVGNKLIFVNKDSALIKLNATGLLVESEKIAERQITGTYATITTGFGRLFQDSVLIVDGDLDYATNGFPNYMNIDAEEVVNFL